MLCVVLYELQMEHLQHVTLVWNRTNRPSAIPLPTRVSNCDHALTVMEHVVGTTHAALSNDDKARMFDDRAHMLDDKARILDDWARMFDNRARVFHDRPCTNTHC